MWNILGLFGGEIVQILVDRIARMNLVLYAVQSGHHHRRKGEIRVADRIREAHLNAACFRGVHQRYADGGRPVTSRVCEIYGSFESGYQTLVRVRAGIRDGIERLRVLDNAADVEDREFGESGI